jgi:hypothetical protein
MGARHWVTPDGKPGTMLKTADVLSPAADGSRCVTVGWREPVSRR